MIRSKLVLMGIMFSILIGILANSVCAVKPEDAVGVWLFDEGKGEVAEDISGHGQDGEVLASVKWTKGKFDDALEFPGTVTGTSYVRIPYNADQDLVEHSITAWIKVTPTAGDWQLIVCKWQPHDVRNYSFLTQKDTGLPMAQFTSGGAAQWKTAMGRTVLTDDQWHHIACTYDGSVMKIYVDGVMEGQVTTAEGDLNPGDLTIGSRWAGTHPTTGIIDDVGLFKVALEEDEIADIMNNGLQEVLGLVAVEPIDKLAATWGEIKVR